MQIEFDIDEAQLLWDALNNLRVTYLESEKIIPEWKFSEIRRVQKKLEDTPYEYSNYQSISHWGMLKCS